MDKVCYKHPDRIAVAKIQRQKKHASSTGKQQTVTFYSPVCEQCAEGAKKVGTLVFPLDDKS